MEDDYVKGRGGVTDEVTEHVHLCNVEFRFYTSIRDDRTEDGQEAMYDQIEKGKKVAKIQGDFCH